MYKEDPTQGVPDWLQPFTANLEDLEMHVLAHSSEREISNSEGDASKVGSQKWKHSIHTNFRKYRKRSIPQTEEIGDLAAKVNLRTIFSSLPWYKISPFSGYYPTKTSQETEKNFTEVFRAVTEAKSHLYERFIRIWQVV